MTPGLKEDVGYAFCTARTYRASPRAATRFQRAAPVAVASDRLLQAEVAAAPRRRRSAVRPPNLSVAAGAAAGAASHSAEAPPQTMGKQEGLLRPVEVFSCSIWFPPSPAPAPRPRRLLCPVFLQHCHRKLWPAFPHNSQPFTSLHRELALNPPGHENTVKWEWQVLLLPFRFGGNRSKIPYIAFSS